MKTLQAVLSTDSKNWSALIVRLALGLVILPHGAQKMLGWFGGNGFGNTLDYFTQVMGFPAAVAVLIILIEFFGALFLIFGFFTRLAALGVLGLFTGIALTHIENGFFMNWMGNKQGEGLEYFILLAGLAISTLLIGAGRASIDAVLIKNKKGN